MSVHWRRFCIECVSAKGQTLGAGSYALPEQTFIEEAKQDLHLRMTLLNEITECILRAKAPCNLSKSGEWSLIRACLNTYRQLGDEFCYHELLPWFSRNIMCLLRQDRSGVLGRHALEILAGWQAPDPKSIELWHELLSSSSVLGTPIPRSWKRAALAGLMAADPWFATARICSWPTWVQRDGYDPVFLVEVWRHPKRKEFLVQAIFDGRYGPFRDTADDAHRTLHEALPAAEQEELRALLQRLYEMADPFAEQAKTIPPKAAS